MCPQYKNPTPKNNVKQLLYKQRASVRQQAPTPAIHTDSNPIKPERSVVEPTLTTSLPQNKINKLHIVTTCVNYSDFLIVSLSENVKIIDPKFITVVTDSNDLLTQKVCNVFGVNCVVTDRFYEDGAMFNKGKGLNEGIKSIVNPEWILITDADIVFPKDFLTILEQKSVNKNKLYAATRYLCYNYETFEKYKNQQITLEQMNGVHRCPPVGYFQLFYSSHPNLSDPRMIYPEISNDASWSDMLFADKFPQKECIQNIKLIHLGDDSQNWKGRKTKRFIGDDIFLQIIQQQQAYPFTVDARNKTSNDKLAIITCLFNPIGYRNLIHNYNTFKDGIINNGGHLFTIELSFTGEFITDESKYNIHITGNDDNIMWQKERLLNILIDRLPEEYNNIAWLDSDIIFTNPNWIDEVNEKLQYFKMVQLFEHANLLNGNGDVDQVQTGIIKHLQQIQDLSVISFDHNTGGHPGFGWAARRELLNQYHLMEYQIAGNADGLMLLTILNKFVGAFSYGLMNELWRNETARWGQEIRTDINNSLSCISGDISHLYHGKISNRKYVQRCDMLRESNYDPYKDVIIEPNGLLKWRHNKPQLQQQLKQYFIDRSEDDNLKNDININEYFDGIFCINLNRRPDKWHTVNMRFQKNGINAQRFPAYDGRFENVKKEWNQVKLNLISKYGPQIFNDPNKLSNMGIIENEFAYGTLCSQIGIIQLAKSKRLKRILIFEDDVIFHNEFIQKIQLIKDLNWSLLYLGASQYDWDGVNVKNGIYKANKSLGGFAYAVDESIYDDILQHSINTEKSFDNVLTDNIQTKYPNCFVIYPNLVIADVRESDLREGRDLNEHGSRLRWDLNLYDV